MDFDSELTRGESSPQGTGLRAFRHLAPTTVLTFDRYGAFPPVAVLCHGAFWRAAIDQLLLRVDAVCLDLSGFRPKHEGTGYELQRVIDRFPIERVAFLADPKSNLNFLVGEIDRAWRQMSADSPNASAESRTAHLAVTDRLRITITQNEQGQETGRHTKLVAQRKQTRRVAAGLQLAITSAPPVRREPWGTPATATAHPALGQAFGRVSLTSSLGWVAALVLTLVMVFGLAIAAPGLTRSPVPTGGGTGGVVAIPKAVSVPNVVGGPVGTARQQLEQRGLTVSVTQVQDDAARGIVIGQSPEAGTGAAEGSMVHLTVSAGRLPPTPPRKLTTVPNVLGASVDEARDRIEGKNLHWQVVEDESPSPWPAGTVLDCIPGVGTSVDEGTTVDLYLSSGRNVVPNVVGRTQAAAGQRMRDAGFEVSVTQSQNENELGLVISQSEVAGSSLEVGSEVELTVAISPKPTITETPTEAPTPSPEPTPTLTPTQSPTP